MRYWPLSDLFESVYVSSDEGAMTYAIHASKNGQSVVTVRINPIGAVDKARLLESLGWQVHITDSAGHQFNATDFDRFFRIERETA
jgi:hypothetical protein